MNSVVRQATCGGKVNYVEQTLKISESLKSFAFNEKLGIYFQKRFYDKSASFWMPLLVKVFDKFIAKVFRNFKRRFFFVCIRN